ncbi:MAG: carbamoyl-phosphate synthase domain-containing protein [Veillonella parvula]
MKNDFNRKIVLEDGSEYFGYGFGYHTDRVCEIVFNTSMIGYQEIVYRPVLHVSDGSYDISAYRKLRNYGRGF